MWVEYLNTKDEKLTGFVIGQKSKWVFFGWVEMGRVWLAKKLFPEEVLSFYKPM